MIPKAATDTSSSSGTAWTRRAAAYPTTPIPCGSGFGPVPDAVEGARERAGLEPLERRVVGVQRLRPVQEEHRHVVGQDPLELVVDALALGDVGHLAAAHHQVVDHGDGIAGVVLAGVALV